MQKIHEKLNMLKDALGLDKEKEVNEDLIFNFVSAHNHNEFYLLEYIMNKTIYAPNEIKTQNFLLISLYYRAEEYKKQYEAIKEAYENNYIFKQFASSISEDLFLQDKKNCELFNYQIYEICSKYVTNERILEPTDVHLNLHFIQKWMYEQTKLKLEPFTNIENRIIYYLADGYSLNEVVEKKLIKGVEDKKFLNIIIHEILPAKYQVETINQVMALYYCLYPNPAKIEPLRP